MTKKILKFIGILILTFCLISIIFYFGFFLRQPQRNVPNNGDFFVSPANGKIIAIINNPTSDEILYKKNNAVLDNFVDGIGEESTMISIMMTPLNVHYQKAPNNAKLIKQEYFEGKNYNAMKNKNPLKATFQNEYNNMLFEQEDGTRFRVIQIAGKLARRIVPFLKINDIVEQGDTIGLIKFGSQVTIVFDKNVDIIAKVGDVVIDGETILAKKILIK